MSKDTKNNKSKVSPKEETKKQEAVDEGVDKDEMSPEEYVNFLEESLGKALAEARDNKNQAQRLQAEFENYRKRTESYGTDMKKIGIVAVVEKMIEVLDNCDRARQYIKDPNALMGFNMMEQQIIIGLKTFGLDECDVKVGDELDVKCMEAIEREVNPELDGKVSEVLSKGYKINDMVVRPAKVKVGYVEKIDAENK